MIWIRTKKTKTTRMTTISTDDFFPEFLHSAMRKQGRGHSVGYAALELAQQQGIPVAHAHLISRAAEVHARLLKKEARRVRVVGHFELSPPLARLREPQGATVGSGMRATSSASSHTWSAIPAAIAGVTRRV